jgi:hypothetical protein
LIFCMVLSNQRTPYSIMYVWAAFEAKSPPTRQDLATLISNYTLYSCPIGSAADSSLCKNGHEPL